MKSFWDERYSSEEYAYGVRPNDFLVEAAKRLPTASRILSLGEGEGRNAIFLAKGSHKVTAVDQSDIGLLKTQKLALSQGCTVETVVSDLWEYEIGEQKWDAIVSIFCHVPSELRRVLYPKIRAGLKTGGFLIVEAYAPEQLKRNSGGPKEADLLVSRDELQTHFSDFEIVHLQALSRVIQEGLFHKGLSDVTQFIGINPVSAV